MIETTIEQKKITTGKQASAPAAISLEASPQFWADRLKQAWGKSVASTIAIGQILIEAKAKASRNFGRIFYDHPQAVEHPFKISQHAAEQFMRVARNRILSDSTHWVEVPSPWRTLYELSGLPDETLLSFIRAGIVFPGMTRIQAEALVYGYKRYKDFSVEKAREILAYQKKLKRREADAVICCCACGHKHPAPRMKLHKIHSQNHDGMDHNRLDGHGEQRGAIQL